MMVCSQEASGLLPLVIPGVTRNMSGFQSSILLKSLGGVLLSIIYRKTTPIQLSSCWESRRQNVQSILDLTWTLEFVQTLPHFFLHHCVTDYSFVEVVESHIEQRHDLTPNYQIQEHNLIFWKMRLRMIVSKHLELLSNQNFCANGTMRIIHSDSLIWSF